MKKLLLTLATAFTAGLGAQTSFQIKDIASNSVLLPNSTIYTVTTAQMITTMDIDIKNTSSSTHTYVAKRYDMTLHSVIPGNDEASAYFCFGGTCYGPATYTAMVILQAGKAASDTTAAYYILMTDLYEASTTGFSHVKYTFYDMGNKSDSTQISIRYNDPNGPVGLKELGRISAGMDIYPNPAHETANLKINASKAFQTKLMVMNALGDVVHTEQVSLTEGRNRIEIPVGTLPGGVYFVSMRVNDANVTRKLVVK